VRIKELEAHVESLKEGLENAPYPSDLRIAEADRDHFLKQRDELLKLLDECVTKLNAPALEQLAHALRRASSRMGGE
jgi:hypothetical protein